MLGLPQPRSSMIEEPAVTTEREPIEPDEVLAEFEAEPSEASTPFVAQISSGDACDSGE
jgi:hypothetical protein